MQIVHFTPPQLARMFKVNESTIKRWIDKGIMPSSKTPGGHYRITHENVQTFLKRQPQVRRDSYILSRWHSDPTTDTWRIYYDHHKKYQPTEARNVLMGAFVASGSVLDTLERVVVPALMEIGVAWRAGNLDIADEHRMSFLIRCDLLALEELLPTPAVQAPTILLACTPKENHELALHLLGLVAREQGWLPIILGINVPAPQIEHVVAERTIDLIGLSKATASSQGVPFVRTVRTLPKAKRIPIVVGGGGWQSRDRTVLGTMRNVSVVDSLHALANTLQKHA